MAKKTIETLDLTELQKRGILRKIEQTKKSLPEHKNGYFDLSQTQNPKTTNSAETTNPLSLLDALASASTAQSTSIQTTQTSTSDVEVFDKLRTLVRGTPRAFKSPEQNTQGLFDLADLKVKLEDLEYKLERFLEKIAQIETKLLEFEKKINQYRELN